MTDLTPDRLQELRRIAEAATPGPLRMHPCEDARYAAFVDAPHLGPDAPEVAVFLIERDARFFAEFDRDTVLALLDEIERLRRERDNWKRVAEQKTDALCDVAEERARLRAEREVLAEAVLAEQRRIDYVNTHATADETAFTLDQEAHRTWEAALALLDGEKGGNVNPLAAYTDGQLYDELHRRGWVAATWPTKGGGGA